MVTIEQFSRIRAAIEAGNDTLDILREEGLNRAAWRAAERRFIALLIRETERGEHTHRRVFREAMLGAAAQAVPPPAPAPPRPAPSPSPPRPVFEHAPPTHTVDTPQVVPAARPTPVPFAGVATAPRRVGDEVAREAEDMIGETTTVSALTDEELADGLPFEQGESGIDETAIITSLDIGNEPPMPFAGSGDAPPAIGRMVEEEARDLVGETGMVVALTDAELTLQQYASLVVELERASPERRTEVMHRYSVPDDEVLSRIQRAYNESFRLEPARYGEFRAAYDAYSDWLKGS
jgi:hypothetical protein